MVGVAGGWVGALWTLLLVVGMGVALLSFHQAVARQVYALSREGVLPPRLAVVGRGKAGGAPVAGSVLQSVVALTIGAVAVGTGTGPLVMFAWLSAVAAVGVIVLLVGCSAAALGFFHRNPHLEPGVWIRSGAPALGMGTGAGVLALMVTNVDSLLQVPAGSLVAYVPPAVVAVTAVAGGWWGLRLRVSVPAVWEGIGRGRPHPLAVLDDNVPEV
jgi:amino acid transporter